MTDRKATIVRESQPRRDVTAASGINLIAGLWLLASPFVLDYEAPALWNALLVGAVIALFASMRTTFAFEAAALSWVNCALGVWLFVSPLVLETSTAATWSNVVVGFTVAVWGFASAVASPQVGPRQRADTERDPDAHAGQDT